jgi:MFS family permease
VRRLRTLYAAGFVTAFGAHAVAANLGRFANAHHASLLDVGILLAIYDGAEVVLKPAFGVLTDRIGPKPVLIGGLVGFAAASAAFVLAGNPDALGLARLAQGSAAAAFSPAAGTLVATLGGTRERGRSFGGYGAAKGLGYVTGPVVGGGLVLLGGYPLLFILLATLAVAVALASVVAVPGERPAPRPRETVVGLFRRLRRPAFVRPTLALAGATAALSAGVGFFPLVAARAHLGPLASGVVVSLLAGTAALVQPRAGRAFDAGRLQADRGLVAGLIAAAVGFALASTPLGAVGLGVGAAVVGAGVGLVTPLGFAMVAGSAPEGRMGQTMGAAEVGRELGDAGGPMLVGIVGTASLVTGIGTLAGVLAVAAVAIAVTASTDSGPDEGRSTRVRTRGPG